MAATLSITRTFEVSLSRSSLYVELFGLALFAAIDRTQGVPMWEVSRWELGHGWRLQLGPLKVDAGRA